GPAILLLHEAPGLTPNTFRLAHDIAAGGYRVYVPLLFGTAGKDSLANVFFRLFDLRFLPVRDATPPIVGSLERLAKEIHEQTGQDIGVIGMCLTGNLPIPMLQLDFVKAAVVSQPAMPLFRPSTIGLDKGDVGWVRTHKKS